MAVTTWKTDPTHTDIGFSAKHMMVTTIRGKFATAEGTLLLDEANPTASSGTFAVDVASITSGVERRDGHLRSADFFDAERWPQITFASTKVEARGGNEYRVTGNLTIRDTTRPATFDVEYLGTYAGMGGGRRAGFHGTTVINREDWGLTWNVTLESGGWLVGKDIKIEIDAAVEEAAAVSPEPVAVPASA